MNNHTQNPAIDAPQGANALTLNPIDRIDREYIQVLKQRYMTVKKSFERLAVLKKPSAEAAEYMVEDVELLLSIAKRLQVALSENEEPQPFKINPPRHVSVADLIKRRNHEMGLEPLPLESDLLLKRIAQGGHSGQFLADAFFSAYRTNQPFTHSLGELMKLDAEGFRLFHEILHIRYISGWNDDSLYQIEQQVIAFVGGVK